MLKIAFARNFCNSLPLYSLFFESNKSLLPKALIIKKKKKGFSHTCCFIFPLGIWKNTNRKREQHQTRFKQKECFKINFQPNDFNPKPRQNPTLYKGKHTCRGSQRPNYPYPHEDRSSNPWRAWCQTQPRLEPPTSSKLHHPAHPSPSSSSSSSASPPCASTADTLPTRTPRARRPPDRKSAAAPKGPTRRQPPPRSRIPAGRRRRRRQIPEGRRRRR